MPSENKRKSDFFFSSISLKSPPKFPLETLLGIPSEINPRNTSEISPENPRNLFKGFFGNFSRNSIMNSFLHHMSPCPEKNPPGFPSKLAPWVLFAVNSEISP